LHFLLGTKHQEMTTQFFPASWKEFVASLSDPQAVATKDTYHLKVDKEKLEIYAGSSSSYFTLMRDLWYPIIGLAFFYLLILQIIPLIMKNRKPVKPKKIITLWNLTLCVYSTIGTVVVVNQILFGDVSGLFTADGSWYKAVCSHSSSFATGYSGIAVLLFVVGKVPELVDTVWLLLAKREVNLLHSWHHFSVLLWSWHSYITATSLGLLFGYMNYQVHSIMYFYYAMTQVSDTTRAMVRPFARYVTTIQIVQMFFGIFILCSAMYYTIIKGQTCYTDPTNNMLAVLCYSTYFYLFLDLYVKRYTCPSNLKKKVA